MSNNPFRLSALFLACSLACGSSATPIDDGTGQQGGAAGITTSAGAGGETAGSNPTGTGGVGGTTSPDASISSDAPLAADSDEVDVACGAPNGACCGQMCLGGATCQMATCRCPGAATACGLTCADTTTSPAHCGKCGHDCLGGKCVAGVCQPVDIATAQGRLFVIRVDASQAYWGGDGVNVMRRPKDLSAPAKPLTGAEYAYSLVLDDQFVYWSNDWKDTEVRQCILPDCNGGAMAIETGTSAISIDSMAIDTAKKFLFYSRTDGTAITRKALPAGATTPLVMGAGRRLRADGQFLYYANAGGVFKKDFTSAQAVVPLATGANTADPTSMAINSKAIYWAQKDGIYSAPLPNGIGAAAAVKFAPSDDSVLGMVADEATVYWTNRITGNVSSCPVAGCGGPPTIVAPAQASAWGITLDEKAIYWVSETGEVRKIAK